MKFRIPPYCVALVHDGARLAIAPDGSVDASDEAEPALRAHGLVPWRDPDPPRRPSAPDPGLNDIDGMSRSDLISALRSAGVAGPLSPNVVELRKSLRQARARRTRPETIATHR